MAPIMELEAVSRVEEESSAQEQDSIPELHQETTRNTTQKGSNKTFLKPVQDHGEKSQGEQMTAPLAEQSSGSASMSSEAVHAQAQMLHTQMHTSMSMLHTAFQKLDSANTGLLNFQDFVNIMKSMEHMKPAQMYKLILASASGYVRYASFLDYFCGADEEKRRDATVDGPSMGNGAKQPDVAVGRADIVQPTGTAQTVNFCDQVRTPKQENCLKMSQSTHPLMNSKQESLDDKSNQVPPTDFIIAKPSLRLSGLGPLAGAEPRCAERLPPSRKQAAEPMPPSLYAGGGGQLPSGRSSSASRALEVTGSSRVAAAVAQARSITQSIVREGDAFGVSSPQPPVKPAPVPVLTRPKTATSFFRDQLREPLMPPTPACHVIYPSICKLNNMHSLVLPHAQVASRKPLVESSNPVSAPASRKVVQLVFEEPIVATETDTCEEPLEPKPPSKLDLVNLSETSWGSVGLWWGADDDCHLLVNRVEIQIWSVDCTQLLPMLQKRQWPGALSIITVQLQGYSVAIAHSLDVRFPGSEASGAQASNIDCSDSSQIRAALLLKQEQVDAHVGTSTTPAPVSIEGIPHQKPVVVRVRLYSKTTSRCGSWGTPCMLVVLPNGLNGVDLQSALADENASAADASLIKIKAWGNRSG